MSLDVFSIDKDKVIDSYFISCKTTYEFAIQNMIPLISKLDIQRKVQSQRFYNKLVTDITNGCIMPPLTLAFIDNVNSLKLNNLNDIKTYILDNIDKGFILDGIQRLTALKKAFSEDKLNKSEKLNINLPIFFNVLICPSHDKLLYRMITLNNGQKPMTMRHQMEILLGNMYSFDNEYIKILSEKKAIGKNARGSFKKASFISAYLAFMSDSLTVDNKKIIEDKLNELLASRVMQFGIAGSIEFSEVISLVGDFSQKKDELKQWFKNENNLIGFSVAMRDEQIFEEIKSYTPKKFYETIDFFEQVFDCINVSKVRVSNYRRAMVYTYFKTSSFSTKDVDPVELAYSLSEQIEKMKI